MLSLNLESRILGLAQAQGLLTEASAEALDPALVLDPKALQYSSLWGPRLDRLMAEGRLETATVEALAWSLLNPGKDGSPDESWMAGALPSVLPDLEGRTVADRYERLAFLGEGALGRVYKAYDTLLHRWVALKFLKTTIPGQEAALLTEARAQAQVEHPHVCRIYEVGEAEGHGFIAMQWVEGTTLAQAMEGMSLREKVGIVRDLAEGVHAAHRRGLVHLDLKPGNVLVQKDDQDRWQALVTDFGMMRSEAEGQEGPCPMGTPPYSSPEQLEGDASHVDRRSDVYSLGVVLYVMLTGSFPFEANSFTALLDAVREAKPVPLRSRDRSLPEDLEAVVSRCLDKIPTRRYPSAQALADDLQRFLDGETVQAQSASLRYRLRKWTARNRVTAWVGALGLVALLVAGGVGIVTTYQARRQGEWAQHFEQVAGVEEAKLRQEYTMPTHDLRPARESVRRAIRQVESELAANGRAARGPAHYALGRLCALLHLDRDALGHLEAAYGTGFRTPEVKVALAVALLNEYEWLWSECDFESTGIADPRKGDLKRKYLDRVDGLLEGIRATASMEWPFTRALILREYSKGNVEGAFLQARKVAQEVRPWDFEAWVLMAIQGGYLIRQKHHLAFTEEMAKRPLQAEKGWRQVLALVQEFHEASQKAIELAPGSPEARYKILVGRGWNSLSNSRNPLELLQNTNGKVEEYFWRMESNRIASEFLRTDPDEPVLKNRAALGWHHTSGSGLLLGMDVRDAAQKALAGFQQVQGFQSTFDPVRFFSASRVLLVWAMSDSQCGIRTPEAASLLSQALRQERLLVEQSGEYRAYMDIPISEATVGIFVLSQMLWEVGEDPLPLLLEWTTASALSERPSGSVGAMALAELHLKLAELHINLDQDPKPDLNRARDLLGQSSMPRSQWLSRILKLIEQPWLISQQRDEIALPLLDSFIKEVLHQPEILQFDIDTVPLQLHHMAYSLRLGRGLGRFAEDARAKLVRLAKAYPWSTEIQELLARLCLLEAGSLDNPIPKLQEGLKAADRALIYPTPVSESDLKKPGFRPREIPGNTPELYHKGRTLKVKGELELALAKAQKSHATRTAQARQALATFEESLKENKNLARKVMPLLQEAKTLAESR